ncbi:MAG: alpha/beta hydrolase [Gammaproteobacteria bacterium]|nr:alpha/beta hydrolase [Gammaproteobacteria bacterium]
MIRPPSLFDQALEGRVVFDAAALLAQLPLLVLQVPRGKGPVMVLPGFMTDDTSTWLLRRFLERIGYSVEGWNLGLNRGPLLKLLDQLEPVLADHAALHGRPVQLIGWSRGGMLARELARRDARSVRSVITMGTPIQGGPGASSIGAYAMRASGLSVQEASDLQAQRESVPIKVPVHSIYSKSDGVVAWQASIDPYNPHTEHHAVHSTHVGMGSHAGVFRLLADLLARYS